jgi:hypothetical protein
MLILNLVQSILPLVLIACRRQDAPPPTALGMYCAPPAMAPAVAMAS